MPRQGRHPNCCISRLRIPGRTYTAAAVCRDGARGSPAFNAAWGRLRQNARMAAFRTLVLPLALLLGGALALPARAEVWGYVDADGTAHVATEQVDARYQLFFKGRTSADAPPPAPAPESTNLDVFR